MKVVITGGAGFVGSKLASELLDHGLPSLAGEPAGAIDELLLVDRVAAAGRLAEDSRVTQLTGELPGIVDRDVFDGADLIVHLAAVVSGAAEADLDLGFRVNLDGTRAVLEAARGTGRRPVLVFSSSLAVYGSAPGESLPEMITEQTLPRPQSSYGTQKLIGEQLVAEYTRRGLVRGRSVRLQTVAVRPGRPNAATSSFVSGIVREPLAGSRAVCPVPGDTPLGISSPRRTVEGLIRAAGAGDQEWGTAPVILPALTTTPQEMLAAMDRVAGRACSELVDHVPDPDIARIVTSWPARFDAVRAEALGLRPEPDFDTIVADYLAENG